MDLNLRSVYLIIHDEDLDMTRSSDVVGCFVHDEKPADTNRSSTSNRRQSTEKIFVLTSGLPRLTDSGGKDVVGMFLNKSQQNQITQQTSKIMERIQQRRTI